MIFSVESSQVIIFQIDSSNWSPSNFKWCILIPLVIFVFLMIFFDIQIIGFDLPHCSLWLFKWWFWILSWRTGLFHGVIWFFKWWTWIFSWWTWFFMMFFDFSDGGLEFSHDGLDSFMVDFDFSNDGPWIFSWWTWLFHGGLDFSNGGLDSFIVVFDFLNGGLEFSHGRLDSFMVELTFLMVELTIPWWPLTL